MAFSERLREFLVSISYRVDRTTERRFDDSLQRSSLAVGRLNKILLASAVSIAYAVTKISDGYEKLYYTSQRTGASVTGIKALEYAWKQLGGTADGLKGSLEGFSSWLRNNPGAVKFLQDKFGITATGDTAKDFMAVGAALKDIAAIRPDLAKLNAEFMGLSEADVFIFSRDPGRFIGQYREMLRGTGLDLEKTSEGSVQFMQQLRELLTVLGWLKDKVLSDLQQKIGPSLEHLTKYIVDNLPEIATNIENLAIALGDLGLGLYKVALGILRLKQVSSKDGTQNRLVEAAKGSSDEEAFRLLFSGGGMAARWADELKTYASTHGIHSPLGLRQNNPGNLRRWGNNPTENGFAKFGSSSEGLSAMAAQLLLYGGRGLDTIQEIISTWAPSSENDTNAYVAAVSGRMGGMDPDGILNLRDPAVLASLMSAMIQQEQGRNPFSNLDLLGAANGRLGMTGAGGASVVQTTNINVTGSGDPAAVGQAVLGGQERVNQNMIRNMPGALR